jgi:hypothetical protein
LQNVVFLIWCVLISLKLAMTTSTNVAIQTIELFLSMWFVEFNGSWVYSFEIFWCFVAMRWTHLLTDLSCSWQLYVYGFVNAAMFSIAYTGDDPLILCFQQIKDEFNSIDDEHLFWVYLFTLPMWAIFFRAFRNLEINTFRWFSLTVRKIRLCFRSCALIPLMLLFWFSEHPSIKWSFVLL